MKFMILALLACLALANCGRKAPIKAVPGTLLDDIDFTQPILVEDEDDEFNQPNEDQTWLDLEEDDDDEDEE